MGIKMNTESAAVQIVEVGPRDGLQSIRAHLPTTVKQELIQRLVATGLRTVEITSIVSPKAIRQLADHAEVLASPRIQSLIANPSLRLPVLVPNLKGLQRALDHGVREVAVFVSATEGFSKANINCTVEQGLKRAAEVVETAKSHGIAVRGYVSCIFACPYDGLTPSSAVLRCVGSLLEAGCYQVSLGDTTGVGTPGKTRELLSFLLASGIHSSSLAGHFHDTYGQALANAWEAYTCGLRVFDSSVAGLGGCPYAPGARGNLSSEDLVYMFEESGVNTGVNLGRLAEVGDWISSQLKVPNGCRAGVAIMAKREMATAGSLGRLSQPTSQFHWEEVKSTDCLIVLRYAKTAKIILNRPENGNALTASMINDLTKLFHDWKQDKSLSRIILTANGKFFCTGMDLSKGSSPVGKDGNASENQFNLLTTLFRAIDDAPQVTLAGINGPCFGGGVGLALACDIRIASPTASITLSEVRLGLAAATISRYVVRELGIPFAREALLSARAIPASELKQRGIVALVSDSAKVLDQALEGFTHSLRKCAPGASTMSKELVKLGWSSAGCQRQDDGIKRIFEEMMRPDAEGSRGISAFQSGQREIDWDLLDAASRKAKL